MPLLGFTVFKDKILSGVKAQTIRKRRKRPIKLGDKLYLYWHTRQPDCEKLGESFCIEEFLIQIHSEYWAGRQRPLVLKYKEPTVWQRLSSLEVLVLAQKDGFQGLDDFHDWFINHYGSGEIYQVIRWDKNKLNEGPQHDRTKKI